MMDGLSMRARHIALELRMVLFLCFYLIGFSAPWERSGRSSTLWLSAATNIARAGWLNLGYATITVTLIALGCLAIGSSLRVWGRLILGHVTQSEVSAPMAGCLELRNPLFLGSCLVGLATSILMPPGGAVFFLIASGLFLLTLHRLCRVTPMAAPNIHRDLLVGRLQSDSPALPGSGWLGALLAEFYPISYTLCFGVLARRYNAHMLVRCLLLSFGFSLILQAFLGSRMPVARIAEEPDASGTT